MLVNFSYWWDHLSEILDFLEIDQEEKFPKKEIEIHRLIHLQTSKNPDYQIYTRHWIIK